MRIGLDARLMAAPRTGIGSYTVNLVRSLAGLDGSEEYHLFSDRPLPPVGPRFSNPVIPLRKRILWTMLALPVALRTRRIDLYHGTANFEVPPLPGCRLVATVHDLIPLHFPGMVTRRFAFLFRSFIGRAVRCADRVITDSEFSRQDILERFSPDPRKVTAVPLAADPRFSPDPDPEGRRRVRERYRLPGLFLLCVGVIERRKNIPLLVEAFERFRRGGGDYTLVLAGGPGYEGEKIAGEIEARGEASGIRLLGHVPDEDLPWLYRAAELLVFPSRYEGFGFPALEAMACGTPVLAADTSSLRELVDGAGELFEPGDPGLLAGRLDTLLSSDARRAELARLGLERARSYSWEETARRTLAVYRDVLDGGAGTG